MTLGLSLSCNQIQTLRQSHRLDQRQSLQLEQILELEQKLISPSFPNALRGLEGIKTADQILKEKNYAGLLIGGLASAVWSKRGYPKDLTKHKDVDVAVIGYNGEAKEVNHNYETFEGGIDWWLPQEEKLTINAISGNFERNLKWFENGNNVILYYTFKDFKEKQAGLYLPSPKLILAYLENQIRAASTGVSVDEEVFEKFKEKREISIGNTLSQLVSKYNCCDEKEAELNILEHRDISAIHKYIE